MSSPAQPESPSASKAPIPEASIVIEKLESADVPHAAALYAETFFDNAAYSCLVFGSVSSSLRREALHWLFVRRTQLFLDLGATFLAAWNTHTNEDGTRDEGKRTLVACAGIVAPGVEASTWAKIRAGILLWPWLWGWTSFRAALNTDQLLGKPQPDDWMLSQVAVSPSMQGRGLGSRLLRQLLATVPDFASASIYLNTQRKINIEYYRRAGFVLEERRAIDITNALVTRHDTLTNATADVLASEEPQLPEHHFYSWTLRKPAHKQQ